MVATLGRAALPVLLILLLMHEPWAARAQPIAPPGTASSAGHVSAEAPPQPTATPPAEPPLPSSSPARAVCAYLAIGAGDDRAIDPGFAAPAPPRAAPPPLLAEAAATPTPGRAAASAYCHPIPPLAPIGSSPGS